MRIKLITIAVLIFLLSLCDRDEPFIVDYFIFGSAYGECLKNCANFFLIKNKNLYPDSVDYYYSFSSLIFNSYPLSIDKYKLAKELVDNFPKYLKSNANKTFGCPDCYDQGGIHIEIKENGQIKYWHIDTDVINQPIEIRTYIQDIQNVIKQLQLNL